MLSAIIHDRACSLMLQCLGCNFDFFCIISFSHKFDVQVWLGETFLMEQLGLAKDIDESATGDLSLAHHHFQTVNTWSLEQ